MRSLTIHVCLIYLAWTATCVTMMPFMYCTKPSIDLETASNAIESMFDRLVLDDVGRAHHILNLAIKAASNPFVGHVMPIDPIKVQWNARIAHIRRCRQIQDYGFRSFGIFGSLIQEHFRLLMSFRAQNRLLLCMMQSIYLYDVGEEGADAAALASRCDDVMAALLLKHSIDREYNAWQTYLNYIEDE